MISQKSTWYCGKNFQHLCSVNVWCGMTSVMLTSPVISEDHMAGQSKLYFLQNGLPRQIEDFPLATRIMYFQHDGVSSHYTWLVLQHLNDTFPNRWIDRGSTITCPPRSPDITTSEFCLWSWMKSVVLDHIMDVIARINEINSDELQSALLLTVKFLKIYNKPDTWTINIRKSS